MTKKEEKIKIVNCNDLSDLRKFFEKYGELSISDMAIIASVNRSTIRRWKKKYNIKPRKDPFAHLKIKKNTIEVPKEVWDNARFLRHHYVNKQFGLPQIAKIMGYKSLSIVEKHLKRHGIKIKKLKINPCMTTEWLTYHYSTRKEYVRWCMVVGQTPDKFGGIAMSARSCAEMAGVIHPTIINWLTHFKMRIRDKHETAWLNKETNSRKMRDNYFHLYRNGIVPLIVSDYKFKNGTKLDHQKDKYFGGDNRYEDVSRHKQD